MIATKRADLDGKFRLFRQHAMSVPDTVRHGASQVIFESYRELGYNYRMTDIQAAVGREQLKRLPYIVERRRDLASRYHQLLADIDGLSLPVEPDWARSNWQSYCVRLPAKNDQRAVMQAMLDSGVSTRRGIMCSHREEAHKDIELRQPLTRSELAQDHCIVLPLYPQMTEKEQNRVAKALKQACRALSSKERERLSMKQAPLNNANAIKPY